MGDGGRRIRELQSCPLFPLQQSRQLSARVHETSVEARRLWRLQHSPFLDPGRVFQWDQRATVSLVRRIFWDPLMSVSAQFKPQREKLKASPGRQTSLSVPFEGRFYLRELRLYHKKYDCTESLTCGCANIQESESVTVTP